MNLKTFVFVSFVVVVVCGALLHFVYDWAGRSPAVAFFAATNESTFEHMKLLAVPFLLTTAGLWVAGPRLVQDNRLSAEHRNNDVLFSRAAGLMSGWLFIPAFFYTYTRGFGSEPILWLDITSFVAAAAIAEGVSFAVMARPNNLTRVVGVAVILFIAVSTILFSYIQPDVEPWKIPDEE